MTIEPTAPRWMDWAARLNAIAQIGLTFARDPFDIQRYTAIRQIAAEIIAESGLGSIDQIAGTLAEQIGYATPKVDVRCAIFAENRILLVRERSDGKWTLPGGWADVRESLRESAIKEVREESGYEVEAVKLIAVDDRNKHPHEPQYINHVYKCFVLCKIKGGSPQTSDETDGVEFFPEHELPELSLARVTAEQIARAFLHYRNPHFATEFD